MSDVVGDAFDNLFDGRPESDEPHAPIARRVVVDTSPGLKPSLALEVSCRYCGKVHRIRWNRNEKIVLKSGEPPKIPMAPCDPAKPLMPQIRPTPEFINSFMAAKRALPKAVKAWKDASEPS